MNESTILDNGKRNFDFYLTFQSDRGEGRIWGYGRNFTLREGYRFSDSYHKPLTDEVLNTFDVLNVVRTYFIHHGKTAAKKGINILDKSGFCEMCCQEEAVKKYYGELKKNWTYVDWMKCYEVVLHSPMLCGPCYDEAEEERIAFRMGA